MPIRSLEERDDNNDDENHSDHDVDAIVDDYDDLRFDD